MKFTKMHGSGNDYIYVNCFLETVENPNELSIKISDRHFGIGGDGLVLIKPSDVADFKMEIYNADGSQGEMCGNATCCIGKYVYEKGLTDKEVVTLETLAGIKILDLNINNNIVESVTVNMGSPILEPVKIPVISDSDENFVNKSVIVDNKEYKMTCVSMGNPHAIVYMDDIDSLDLEKIGPSFENHPIFPNRVNTEFLEVIDRNTIKMRVWERGSGETLACGTGACASLVASALNYKTDNEATVILRGGSLYIKWDRVANIILMTGKGTFVFEGEIDV